MLDFFKRYVFANFAYKVVSLALAVGLWAALARDPAASVAVTVPIEFHNIPTNLEISSVNIPEAQVRVRGPERLIHDLRTQEVHVEVDLTGVRPGQRTFDLTAQQVRQPRDLEVAQVIPSQVQLTFDTGLVRQVEVHPRVVGTFASGFRIAQVVSDPRYVSISGPRQHVEAVEAAVTDPVDATGNVGRATFVTNAFVPDPLVQIVHPVPVRVIVIMGRVGTEPGSGTKTSE